MACAISSARPGRCIGIRPDSLLARSGGFFAGEVRLGDLTYFLAATGGLLYLTISTLQARRVHG